MSTDVVWSWLLLFWAIKRVAQFDKRTWTPNQTAQAESLPYGNDELLPNMQINYWQSEEMGIPLIVQADYFPLISQCLLHA